MGLILRLLLNTFAVIILSYLLSGVHVDSFLSALMVAIVLGILNFLVKPILVLLTLPATILTLGLFLLVINAVIIFVAAGMIDGFSVDGWLWAIIFSFLLSVLQSFLHSLTKEPE